MEYWREIDVRNTELQVPELAMKCDAREIPEPLGGPEPVGWWVAAETTIALQRPDGNCSIVERQPSALAVCEDRVMGIIGPKDVRTSALWWTLPWAELVVEAVGSQGLFRKRPNAIKLTYKDGVENPDGCLLAFAVVLQLYPRAGKTQWGQEQTLFDALLQSQSSGH